MDLERPETDMKPLAYLSLACVSLFVSTRSLHGQPDELASKVRRLVRQLDDDFLASRNRAEQQLLELGDPILELLPTVTSRTSNEVRQRLIRIRQQLERAAASRNTSAAVVHLQGEMNIADALRELQRQSGNQLMGVDGRSGRVTLTLDDVPYWIALDKILDQAELAVASRDNVDPRLTLFARPDRQGDPAKHASYSKAFRFELLQLVAGRNLRNPRVNSLTARMQVIWEPRIEPVTIKLRLDEVTVEDDQGESLLTSGPQGTLTAEVTGVSSTELQLPLRLPSRDARKIAKLVGEIEATVLGRTEQFEFADLLATKNVEQSKAAATVVFEETRKNGDIDEVRMLLRFNNAQDTFESHRDWISRNEGFLIDKDGQRIDPTSVETFQRRENQIGRVYSFSIDGGISQCKFVYKTPGVIVKERFSFRFADVPLP